MVTLPVFALIDAHVHTYRGPIIHHQFPLSWLHHCLSPMSWLHHPYRGCTITSHLYRGCTLQDSPARCSAGRSSPPCTHRCRSCTARAPSICVREDARILFLGGERKERRVICKREYENLRLKSFIFFLDTFFLGRY